ncbi:hypothetical protein [Sphingobacterium rhinopitheci]|uniref:hypothetical protein n=1 Tax=Sphingobacterium rhinopitheci TaxID=2781960 RepID=UPI001F525FFC|nr:hypothetical protein [Sphingobacterium rhinopitheci]MCI0922777.1 hypothetical protein [Sphingobacterium rhinopitheci]
MKLKTYLNFMVINKNFAKRILMLCLVVITFISTALKCQKEDWQYETLPGLENKKIFADIIPNKTIYNVGDTIRFQIDLKPNDLNLVDFDKFEYAFISDYLFYDKKQMFNVVQEAGQRLLETKNLTPDKSIYKMQVQIKLNKKGSFRIMTNHYSNPDKLNDDTQFSLLGFYILSGKRVPRGYTGTIPIIFNINKKGYLDIEVE